MATSSLLSDPENPAPSLSESSDDASDEIISGYTVSSFCPHKQRMFRIFRDSEETLGRRVEEAAADLQRIRVKFMWTLLASGLSLALDLFLAFLVNRDWTALTISVIGIALVAFLAMCIFVVWRERLNQLFTQITSILGTCKLWITCGLLTTACFAVCFLIACCAAVNLMFTPGKLDFIPHIIVAGGGLLISISLLMQTIWAVGFTLRYHREVDERNCFFCYKEAVQQVRDSRGIILFSAPYQAASAEIEQLTSQFVRDKPGIFVFDPDKSMETFARAQLMDQKTQGMRWLQIWMDFFLLLEESKRTGCLGEVHVMIPSVPEKKDQSGKWSIESIDRKLKGNAQHGEVRIAVAAGFVSEETGLFFHPYEFKQPTLATKLQQLLSFATVTQREATILFGSLIVNVLICYIVVRIAINDD